MPPRKLAAAMYWFVLVFVLTRWSCALQVPPVSLVPQNANDLAAYEAFCRLLGEQKYSLPEEKVLEVVLAFLRRDTKSPPKTMPTVKELQGEVDVDFEANWTTMITKAKEGLDSKGELGVATRLRARVDGTRLQSDAKKKHANLVESELPKTLDRVKKLLTKDQTEKLVAALRRVVTSDMPGQRQIGEALAGNPQEAVKVLTTEVLGQQGDLLAVLITDSFDALSAAADNVVSDGVKQLKAQLEILEDQPTAVSQGAIQKEMESRLQELAKGQQAERGADRLRPSYGVFSRVGEELPAKAQQWFDQQVAVVGNQVSAQVASGERKLSDKDEDVLRQLILANLPAHHEPADSWRIAQPAIREMIARSQQWIVDDRMKDFAESESPDDRNYAADRFRQDVVGIVDAAGTQSHAAWTKLQKALEQQYEKKLLPVVRKKIADQQASQYAPDLMNGNWIPTERELDSSGQSLRREALTGLAVWKDGPPQQRTQVLLETWDLWLNAAQEALQVTRQAREGQLSIVRDLTPTIRKKISEDPEPTVDKWVTRFCQATKEEWNARQPKIAVKYPELFDVTVAQITTFVTELLPVVEKERSQKQRAVPEPKEEPPQQVAPDDAMAQPVPEQPPQPKTSEATKPTDGQGGAGESESQGKPDGSAKSDEKGGPAEAGDGGAKKDEGKKDEEPKADKGDDEGAGEGKGEGDGEGDGKKEDAQDADSNGELLQIPGVRIAPTQRSWADLVYRMAVWVLLMMMLVMTVCWYYHVRYLRRLLAQYVGPTTLNV